LQRNVGLVQHRDIDRQQKVLAVNLQAVSRIIDKRDRIGPFAVEFIDKIRDRLAHLGLRRIGNSRYLKPGRPTNPTSSSRR